MEGVLDRVGLARNIRRRLPPADLPRVLTPAHRRLTLSEGRWGAAHLEEDNYEHQISARVARTLAALDHGAPEAAALVDAVPPTVRRVAALLGCSTEAAAYINALENCVAALEEKVSELRYDVRQARRAA